MKVAILGAAGKTGSVLTAQALADGHEVLALARSPEKIESDDPRIEKRAADAWNLQSIVAALEGAEAVVTSVGAARLSDRLPKLSTTAHAAVIAGMRAHGCRRLLVISSIGAARNVRRKGWRRNLYVYLRRDYYQDMYEMEQQVLAAGLDATVLRAPRLTSGPATGQYRVFEEEDYYEEYFISRADLAHFMLREMVANQWVDRRVAIAGQ